MVRALAGASTVILVPGLLVAAILGLSLRRLLTWAAIPAFSLATVFVLGEVTTLLHVPFDLPAFAVLVVVLGGVLVARRLRRPPPPAPPENGTARREELIGYGLLGLGVAAGALTWFQGIRGRPLIPPGGDATRHGWFVARILYEHTVDLSHVLVYDVAGSHRTVDYYPLALHGSAALSARLFGADIGRVLVAYTVLFSAVVLPLGMFVLARMLMPRRPLAAGFTALVVPLLVLFPYFPVAGGDLPLMVAMALVPVTVVLVHDAVLARHPQLRPSRALLRALAPAGLALACIVALHTSEVPVVAFLVLLLVLEVAWRTRDPRMLVPALVRGAAVAGIAVVLLAPTLVALARGVAERAPIDTPQVDPAHWESSLGAILQLRWDPDPVRQGALALLAVIGAALLLMWRRPAWVVGWITFVVLTVLASASTNRFAHELTFPWYHHPHRIVQNLSFFVPFFAGVALSSGVAFLTRLGRRSWVVYPAVLVAIALFTVFSGFRAARAERDYVRTSFDPNAEVVWNQALVARSSLAAFRWLHNHAAPGDTVASEPFVGGSLWMYTQQQVAPLIGAYSNMDPTPRDVTDRIALIRGLQSPRREARTVALARRYQTRWVFFDSHRLPIAPPFIRLDALRRNPDLTPVFHQGGAWVFRIDRT